MIEWTTVLSLILLGISLVVIEIVFVPGTTVVGVIGFGLSIIGVVLSFRYFGTTIGTTTATGTAVASAVILYFTFKSNVWGRFASSATMASRVNEEELRDLTEGAEGITVSALRPIGKAELNGKVYEVKSFGGYLETGTRIKVMRIQANQVIVEQIN